MDYRAKRAQLLKQAQDLLDGAKGRDITPDEELAVEAKMAEIKALDEQHSRQEKGSSLLQRLGQLARPEDVKDDGDDKPAKTIGEHFVKHAIEEVLAKRGVKGHSVAAPEYKAATDTQVVSPTLVTPLLTEVDRTIIRLPRPALVLADLLGSGTIGGQAISYFTETGPMEGAFTTVAEGGAKPQIHFPEPVIATDALKKIAGFIKFTDEMLEDLEFLVSEINQRLLYELAKFEESQLINGNGVGTNVLGLLNRSGLQTMAKNSGESSPDVLFRAMTATQTGSGLDPDGIVLHPLDYQDIRLSKDANGQYYGGGFFMGQYGNGTVMEQPPLWGLRTVVTTGIAQGSALVGAFGQAATVYRKGGIRVESTNSHASDFTNNLVTVRAEERVALAVRRPAGIVKVNLTPVP